MSTIATQPRQRLVWLLPATLVLLLAAVPVTAHGQWVETTLDDTLAAEAYGTPAEALDLEQARMLLLELTNESRRAAGLPILAPLPLASEIAQTHADEMAHYQYSNHYDLEGHKCELRFNLAGGVDHIEENTVYYETVPAVQLTPQLVRRMHEHWLQSDSHRANILDPAHTHLGSGFAVAHVDERTYAAAVAEFINVYGDYERLPASARFGEQITVGGRIDPQLATLKYIGVGVDYLPVARDVEYQREHVGGYRSPRVVLALLPRGYLGTCAPEAEHRRYVVDFDEGSGEFNVTLRFEPNWPAAAYYITAWVSPLEAERPEAQDGMPGAGGEVRCAMTQVVLVE